MLIAFEEKNWFAVFLLLENYESFVIIVADCMSFVR